MPDNTIAPWVLGTVLGILSLIGLALASAAEDTVFYGTGLVLFVFGVLFIFGLMSRPWVAEADRSSAAARDRKAGRRGDRRRSAAPVEWRPVRLRR